MNKPSYEALEIIANACLGALARAGFDMAAMDNPGDAIDSLAKRAATPAPAVGREAVATQAEQSDWRAFPMGYDSYLHGLVTDNVASALLCCGINHLPAGVLDTIASEVVRGYHGTPPASGEAGAVDEALARQFHDAYERLAPSFGYETRHDTRAFDPASANGRLMIAVCAEIRRLAAVAPAGMVQLPSVIPCRCADATARRLCMDKHRCSVIEAQAAAPTPPAQVAPAGMDGWQPIETAPKDGKTNILLCDEDGEVYQGFRPIDCPDDAAANRFGIACYPTHWQPLPTPPATAGKE